MPEQIILNRLMSYQVQAVGCSHEDRGYVVVEETDGGIKIAVYDDIRLQLDPQIEGLAPEGFDQCRGTCFILYVGLRTVFTGPVVIKPVGVFPRDRSKVKFAVFEDTLDKKNPWYETLPIEFDVIDLYGNLVQYNTRKRPVSIK